MNYLALCCIVKDEDSILKEWLAYHALLGVEHFYIYDNGSRTPVESLLEGFIDPSQVTVIPAPGEKLQLKVYLDCLEAHLEDHIWIGFLDVDEFACPVQDNDLRVLLAEYEDYAGMVATWNVFGSAGHLTRPSGLVIDSFRERFQKRQEKINLHIKSFVRPKSVHSISTPHFFFYREGEYAVNEDHYPAGNVPFFFSMQRKLKINHYYYRSQQDFAEKLDRGNADNNPLTRIMDWFYKQTTNAVTEDTDILRFVPGVERMLKAGRLKMPFVGPRGDASYEEYVNAASHYLEKGNPDKAQVVLCHAAQAFGNEPDIWILRATAARASGNLERAAIFLKRAFREEGSPAAFQELAELRRAQGRQEEADSIELFIASRL